MTSLVIRLLDVICQKKVCFYENELISRNFVLLDIGIDEDQSNLNQNSCFNNVVMPISIKTVLSTLMYVKLTELTLNLKA